MFGDRFDDLQRVDHPTLAHLPESQLFIDSGADSLNEGPPQQILDELIRTHKVLRRRNLRALLLLVPILLVVSFAAVSTYQWSDAAASKHDAELSRDDEKRARVRAERERKEAIRQRNIATAQKLAVTAPEIGMEFREDEVATLVARQAFLFNKRAAGNALSLVDQGLRSA